MKRILAFVLLGIIAITTIACSSDDNTENNQLKPNLFLKISADTIKEGESITFNVFDNKNNQIDAIIYVNGIQVNPIHKFTKKGTYYVIAKKDDYQNSIPLAITVVDENGLSETSQLELITNQSTIYYGETITFNVQADGKNINDAKISFYQGNEIKSKEWKPTKPGKYRFVASKLNYTTSEVVEITVVLKSTVEDQTITINGNKFKAFYALADFITNEKSEIVLYHDAISAYYVFYVLIDNSGPIFVNCFLKVRVPRNSTAPEYSLVFDKSRVSLMGARGYNKLLGNDFLIDESGFENRSYLNIQKPTEGLKGSVGVEFYSKDHTVEAKYNGEYKLENVLGDYTEQSKNKAVKSVYREFSFDDIKYLKQ